MLLQLRPCACPAGCGPARVCGQPGTQALRVGHAAVHAHHLCTKALSQARLKLGREVDLRHHDQAHRALSVAPAALRWRDRPRSCRCRCCRRAERATVTGLAIAPALWTCSGVNTRLGHWPGCLRLHSACASNCGARAGFEHVSPRLRQLRRPQFGAAVAVAAWAGLPAHRPLVVAGSW